MHLPISRLRTLIGCHLEMGGQECVIMDVLEDGPQFVLQVCGHQSIQADQWGEAHRRTPTTLCVPLYDGGGSELNPQLSAWLAAQLDDE